MDKIFALCGQTALSLTEIAEALGTNSPSSLNRLRAAVQALVDQKLLKAGADDRFAVDPAEVQRLEALARLQVT